MVNRHSNYGCIASLFFFAFCHDVIRRQRWTSTINDLHFHLSFNTSIASCTVYYFRAVINLPSHCQFTSSFAFLYFFFLLLFHCKVMTDILSTLITDRVSTGGNAIASVRLSVRLFPLYLTWRIYALSERLLYFECFRFFDSQLYQCLHLVSTNSHSV